MHDMFSELSHSKSKILKILLWIIDKFGCLESLVCEYCNYLVKFWVTSLHILSLGFFFCRLQEEFLVGR